MKSSSKTSAVSRQHEDIIDTLASILLAARLPDDVNQSSSKMLKSVRDSARQWRERDRTIEILGKSRKRVRVSDIPTALAYGRLCELLRDYNDANISSGEVVDTIAAEFGLDISETFAKHIARYDAGREVLTPTKSAAAILATVTSRGAGPIQDAWLVYQRALSVMKEEDVGQAEQKQAHAICIAFQLAEQGLPNSEKMSMPELMSLILSVVCEGPQERKAAINAFLKLES